MSKAMSLMNNPVLVGGHKEVCSLCNIEKVCQHTLFGRRDIIFCSLCYHNIPDHIPIDQDSEYILAKLKEKL